MTIDYKIAEWHFCRNKTIKPDFLCKYIEFIKEQPEEWVDQNEEILQQVYLAMRGKLPKVKDDNWQWLVDMVKNSIKLRKEAEKLHVIQVTNNYAYATNAQFMLQIPVSMPDGYYGIGKELLNPDWIPIDFTEAWIDIPEQARTWDFKEFSDFKPQVKEKVNNKKPIYIFNKDNETHYLDAAMIDKFIGNEFSDWIFTAPVSQNYILLSNDKKQRKITAVLHQIKKR